METFIERFPHLVLHVFGGLLLALAPILFWCLLKRTGALDRLSAATHGLSTRPRLEQMLVLVLLAGVIVYGSTKDGDNSASPRLRVRPMAEIPSMSIVAPVDVLRGWRVSGTDAGGPVEMPAGAVTNELLRRRGGHDWAFRVEPDNWRSSWRGGFLTGVTVFARGEVRPDVGTLYYPVVVTNGVSLLPEARWGLLPNGGASVFSHAVTTNGSLLLDWRNAAVGRDANSPTNLQMEIFSDGSFVWRTDGGSTSYLPVLPFDWDGDGLENSVDPEPLAPSPVDAHGTSADWCRVVCSNVFETTDSVLGWKEGVNANAYYFVDVVVEEGPAPIHFSADRDSRLGSPVVVARAGETNRVPLLIGVEYSVTSTVPFSVSTPVDGFAVATSDNECSATVKWPLEFTFVEDADTPGAYTVAVVPHDPGGTFAWDRPATPAGGATLLAAAPESSCACWSGSGASVSFDCRGDCLCGGSCRARGSFDCAEAVFPVSGGECRCSRPDDPGDDDPPPPPPDPLVGGLSVSFSKGAVIFEDAYRNTEDGPPVPRRSTTTRLTVSASGGPFGGSFTLTTRNLEKLIAADGPGPVTLASGMTLGPYETYSATFVCAGVEASGSANDVEVEGSFTENVTGWTESPRAQATVVEVEIKPQELAPANRSDHRHIFGVYELVDLIHKPAIGLVEWTLQGGGSAEDSEEGYAGTGIFGDYTLRCPLYNNGATLKVSCRGVDYFPTVRFVEPSGIVAYNPRPAGPPDDIPRGIVGCSMWIDLYVTPMDVSFSQIAVVEVPSTSSTYNGYFLHFYPSDKRSHNTLTGAGKWIEIRIRNPNDANEGLGNFFMTDTATTGFLLAVDEYGEMSWDIPMGWHRKPAPQNGTPPFREFAQGQYRHDFKVWPNGDAWVRKHQKELLRHVQDGEL